MSQKIQAHSFERIFIITAYICKEAPKAGPQFKGIHGLFSNIFTDWTRLIQYYDGFHTLRASLPGHK